MSLHVAKLVCFPEVPTASVCVEGSPALNRVRWAHTGKEIATGDSEGHVQVYDVGEVSLLSLLLLTLKNCCTFISHIAFIPPPNPHAGCVLLQQICVPKADEWTRFVRTLAEINENRDEAEELANV